MYYQKKDTLEKVIKGKSVCRDDSECTGGNRISISKDCAVPCYADIDMSIAMENLWLKTDEIGLGGVWLGIAPIEERMKEVEEIVGIPDDQRAFAIFPLGYPAEERAQQDRFDESRIHFDA